MIRILAMSFFFCLLSTTAFGAPVICFTDLINGPRTGLGDGLGEGAIVTAWGWNLGSSQGASIITVDGVEAAHVYNWSNADTTGTSGPADLFTYHKMQEIAFSIPSGASDGAVKIRVVVNGVASNELDFHIRSGDIFYASATGSGSTGSWASPFGSVSEAIADADFGIGDIVYIKDNLTETTQVNANKAATTNNDCAIISYPGALYQNSSGIGNWAAGTYVHPHWVLSKLKVYNNSTPISPSGMWRIIANEITDNTEANGQGGAVSTNGDQGLKGANEGPIVCYGNYIHDFGYSGTSGYHHVFYISNRGRENVDATDGNSYECILDHTSSPDNRPVTGENWDTYWRLSELDPGYGDSPAWQDGQAYDDGKIYGFHLGWNMLIDNQARNGLHIYDEGQCGDYFGTFDVHHNAVLNQAGGSITVGANYSYSDDGSPCMSQGVRIYSNLLVKSGQPPFEGYSGVLVFGESFTGTVSIYNNTFYGYEGTENFTGIYGPTWSSWWPFGGTYTWVNNIAVDTNDSTWDRTANPNQTPALHSNSIWYNGGDATPSGAPLWATGASTQDPGLVNPEADDYSIDGDSSAADSGTAVLVNAPFSNYGVDGSVLSNDIGAFGYGESDPLQPPTQPKNLRFLDIQNP